MAVEAVRTRPFHRWSKSTPQERFWAKVDKSAGDAECWPWTAGRNRHGYGLYAFEGKTILANRGLWILLHGAVPEGRFVLHHCDNPPCVNPEHLYLGTQAENMRDLVVRGRHATLHGFKQPGHPPKTACLRGHPFDGTNTYTAPNGKRGCRQCFRVRKELRAQ
jgi:hypothetical protein